jgi:hypothetical protein
VKKVGQNAETLTNGFAILEGENGFWRLEPAEDSATSEEMVSLTPLSGDDLSGAIQALIGYNKTT